MQHVYCPCKERCKGATNGNIPLCSLVSKGNLYPEEFQDKGFWNAVGYIASDIIFQGTRYYVFKCSFCHSKVLKSSEKYGDEVEYRTLKSKRNC